MTAIEETLRSSKIKEISIHCAKSWRIRNLSELGNALSRRRTLFLALAGSYRDFNSEGVKQPNEVAAKNQDSSFIKPRADKLNRETITDTWRRSNKYSRVVWITCKN